MTYPINNLQEALLPHLCGSCREEICAVSINQTKEPGRLVWLVETLACGPAHAIPGHHPGQIWMQGGFGRVGRGGEEAGEVYSSRGYSFPSWANHRVPHGESLVAFMENKCWQLPNVVWLATTLMRNHRKNETNQESLDFQVGAWDLQLIQVKWGGFFLWVSRF